MQALQACVEHPGTLGQLLFCAPGTTLTAPVPAIGGIPGASGRLSLSIIGYACAGGSIQVDTSGDGGATPLGFRCVGSAARGWQYTKTLYIHTASSPNPPNQNPQITAVRFGTGSTLSPLDPEAPPAVPRCTDSSSHSRCTQYIIDVQFSADSREHYQVADALTGTLSTATERLTTGYVIDRGRLGGAFRGDSNTDPMSTMANDWIAPVDPGPVSLYVYVSDGRGGFDWTARRLSVQ
jgi:hypothetical protein